ncbi:MAG: DUF5320 domain-containing protein [Spirochaetales bacterium]|uniref:DUF5320 domain-containing protein n=1 Tax=Candidatus Thalassospirochaeta sargassi TaxID=3119039 RepID=A0AAJ1MKI6_9SPIO|nr:DUF5320 domain-containing protein [Spirochaetales bacterium]
MGNGMGPNGMGPRTGRGLGYCNGFEAPGAYSRGGRGMGLGRGVNGFAGGGRGIGRRGFAGMGGYGYVNNVPPVNSEEMLRDEAEFLENRLKAIRDQLDSGKDSD